MHDLQFYKRLWDVNLGLQPPNVALRQLHLGTHVPPVHRGPDRNALPKNHDLALHPGLTRDRKCTRATFSEARFLARKFIHRPATRHRDNRDRAGGAHKSFAVG